MKHDHLSGFLRANDPALPLGAQRKLALQARIMQQVVARSLPQALAPFELTQLYNRSWLTGALALLLLGIITGHTLHTPYTQTSSPSTLLLASTWQSYVDLGSGE